MTFEEAIASPGRLVQLCSAKVVDGSRILSVYRVGDDGATRLARSPFPAEQYDSVVDKLRQRGLVVAERDPPCGFIWIGTVDSIEVYGTSVKIFDATAEHALTETGRIVLRTDIVRVFSFTEADYVCRGLKAE